MMTEPLTMQMLLSSQASLTRAGAEYPPKRPSPADVPGPVTLHPGVRRAGRALGYSAISGLLSGAVLCTEHFSILTSLGDRVTVWMILILWISYLAHSGAQQ